MVFIVHSQHRSAYIPFPSHMVLFPRRIQRCPRRWWDIVPACRVSPQSQSIVHSMGASPHICPRTVLTYQPNSRCILIFRHFRPFEDETRSFRAMAMPHTDLQSFLERWTSEDEECEWCWAHESRRNSEDLKRILSCQSVHRHLSEYFLFQTTYH